jgi:hypothetical protein
MICRICRASQPIESPLIVSGKQQLVDCRRVKSKKNINWKQVVGTLWMITSRCIPCYALVLSSQKSMRRVFNQKLSSGRTRFHSSNLDDLLNEVINSNNSTFGTFTTTVTQHCEGNTVTRTIGSSHNGWKQINWNEEVDKNNYDVLPTSPVEIVIIRDRVVYLKRDDQVSFFCEALSLILETMEIVLAFGIFYSLTSLRFFPSLRKQKLSRHDYRDHKLMVIRQGKCGPYIV